MCVNSVARARALVRRLRDGPDARLDAELRELAKQAPLAGIVSLGAGFDAGLATDEPSP